MIDFEAHAVMRFYVLVRGQIPQGWELRRHKYSLNRLGAHRVEARLPSILRQTEFQAPFPELALSGMAKLAASLGAGDTER